MPALRGEKWAVEIDMENRADVFYCFNEAEAREIYNRRGKDATVGYDVRLYEFVGGGEGWEEVERASDRKKWTVDVYVTRKQTVHVRATSRLKAQAAAKLLFDSEGTTSMAASVRPFEDDGTPDVAHMV